MVNILTSSGLLLKVKDEGFTKIHDVVRDVALLIGSQGNNKFLVKSWQRLTEWLPRDTDLESYKGISLWSNGINKLPAYEVHLPHLQLFMLCYNRRLSMIPDEFIRCMKKIKVLDISSNNISSLPQSFQLLTTLRSLDLRKNESLDEISILGELKDLEILILDKTGIAEIPKEIARLVKLRVLHVKDCADLSRITKGVISALWRLEELSIEFNLKFKGASDCIVEVMSLSKLTYLYLIVRNIDDIPTQGQGFNSENLKGFVIHIGEPFRYEWNISREDRYLVLSSVHLRIPLPKWLQKLIEVSGPRIFLKEIDSLNNIMPTLYYEGFNRLDHIWLNKCYNVSCLVDEWKTEEKLFKELKHLELNCLYKLEVLWKCPDEYVSLANLVTLSIYYCNRLERVFTAQGLANLKKLKIKCSDGLEEVIYGGGGGGDDESGNVIVFSSLASITFRQLPRLKSFFNSAGNCSIEYPSLVKVKLEYCKSMEIWGLGIHETPNLKTLVGDYDVPLDGPCVINEAVEKTWRKFNQDVDVDVDVDVVVDDDDDDDDDE